jgi:hypothetical protein
MKLLIDADYIVYKACAGAEDEIDWGNDVIMVVSSYRKVTVIEKSHVATKELSGN